MFINDLEYVRTEALQAVEMRVAKAASATRAPQRLENNLRGELELRVFRDLRSAMEWFTPRA